MRTKFLTIIGLGTAIIISGFCLNGCESEARTKTIKLAHALDTSHPVHKSLVYMSERFAEKSGGKYRIDIYPSGQLGSEREYVELLQIGSLGMTKVSCSVLEGFVDKMKVFSMPYLFRDDEHRFKVLEGEIGRELLLEGEKYWIRGLCYLDAGCRSFYSVKKPINAPEDLRGLKIRTQESATSIQMIQAMGGSATPIAWGELYTALQQGIVDAAENNPPSFYLSHHHEVAKYFALDEHTAVPDILLISTKVWNDLPPQVQEWLQSAADEAAIYQRELWKIATQEALEEVQKAGVVVSYPDKRPFQEKVKDIYESYRSDPEIYELIQRIRAVQ